METSARIFASVELSMTVPVRAVQVRYCGTLSVGVPSLWPAKRDFAERAWSGDTHTSSLAIDTPGAPSTVVSMQNRRERE